MIQWGYCVIIFKFPTYSSFSSSKIMKSNESLC